MAQYYTRKHPSLRLAFSCNEPLRDSVCLKMLKKCGFTVLSFEVSNECECVRLKIEYGEVDHFIALFRPLANTRYAVAFFYGIGRAELAMIYNAQFIFVPLKQLYFLLDDYETLSNQFFEEICKTLLFMLQPEREVKFLDAAGLERIDQMLLSTDIFHVSSAVALLSTVDPVSGIALLKQARERCDIPEMQEYFDLILGRIPAEAQQPFSDLQIIEEEQPLMPFIACITFVGTSVNECIAGISERHEDHELVVGSLTVSVRIHALKKSDAEFSCVQVKGYSDSCYALCLNGTDWKRFGDSVIDSTSMLPEELLRSVLLTSEREDLFEDAAYCLLLCTTDILIKNDSYKPRESLNYQILEQVKDQMSPAMKEAMAALIR